MRSYEVAEIAGCSVEWVKKLTKKASQRGENIITLNGECFTFFEAKGRGRGGKVHVYAPIDNDVSRRKTVSKEISFAHLSELDGFDVLAKKHSVEEKLLLVRFIKKYNYTMKITIESLLLSAGEAAEKKRVEALRRKFTRWVSLFEKEGAEALEDRRGKRVSEFAKIDEELLVGAMAGAGAKGIRENYYGVHDFYCWAWQQKHSDTFTSDNEKIISYSAIVRGVQKVLKKYPFLRAYWEKGYDGILQAYMVGIKDITYINQEWQVDATRFDFMVKQIQEDGSVKIARHNLSVAIDVYSGNAVATLTEKIDSYAQVRVLYKGFSRMGLPETIYMDNGRDYVSEHYSTVLEDMGIIAINAEVGKGRQKGKVERFFGQVQSALAKIPGYIGNDVAKRTKIENQTASKIDIRTSKATRINESRLLTFEEMATIADNLMAKLSRMYADNAHHLLDEARLEDIRRKLGKRYLRPLHRDGIKLNANTYTAADLWVKGLGWGDKVVVYEDIDDSNVVYVYHDGKFVCRALNREMGAEAMTMEEAKAARKADKKNNIAPLMKQIKDAKVLYEQYEDANAQRLLEATPEYTLPKPKPAKKKKRDPLANNAYMEMILAQEA